MRIEKCTRGAQIRLQPALHELQMVRLQKQSFVPVYMHSLTNRLLDDGRDAILETAVDQVRSSKIFDQHFVLFPTAMLLALAYDHRTVFAIRDHHVLDGRGRKTLEILTPKIAPGGEQGGDHAAQQT